MHTKPEEKGWITDRKLFMQTRGFPPNLPAKKKRFQLLEGVLFKKKFNRVLHHCVGKQQAIKILHVFHSGLTGGHFSALTTIMKIVCGGYYWPH